jgi:hypothetical protein
LSIGQRKNDSSARSNGFFPALNKVKRQSSNPRRQPGSREKSLDAKPRGAAGEEAEKAEANF